MVEEYMTEYVKWMQIRIDSAKNRINHNKKILFDILKKNEISSFTLHFDGSGDSGSFDEVDFEKDNNILIEPIFGAQVLEYVQYSKENGQEFVLMKEPTIKDLIESICCDFLEIHHCGWENNDGSYGDFSFSVDEDKIYLEFYKRQTEFFEHQI